MRTCVCVSVCVCVWGGGGEGRFTHSFARCSLSSSASREFSRDMILSKQRCLYEAIPTKKLPMKSPP